MRLEKAQHTASAYVTCVFGVPEPEVVQARVELAPGMALGRHRHPGEEIVYILEGSLEFQLEGQPPVTLNSGDVLFIPAGTIHAAKNVGSRVIVDGDIGVEVGAAAIAKDDLAGRVMLKSMAAKPAATIAAQVNSAKLEDTRTAQQEKESVL